MMEYRVEKDTLGEVRVPRWAYYGAQTQRAVENFRVSPLRLPSSFIRAQAVIKRAAAVSHMAAGNLDEEIGQALVRAADEIIAGEYHDQFVVDVFQAGAGTSQNMNINEVLANRANEILGAGSPGSYARVHPNDHANMGQSTNDTIHTAIHVAAVSELKGKLIPSLRRLSGAVHDKATEFDRVVKAGRTHLQDAVPMRLGQEFGGYAAMLEKAERRIETALGAILELPLGGTAVGTGLNTHASYKREAIAEIGRVTGFEFRAADDIFEAMQNLDAIVEVAGALRVLVTSLRKVADDLRLLSSGPRTGLAEITLPAVQPGSSIMPGKVNPVLAEMLDMVCFHALGNDTAMVAAAQAGQLELNVMMPVVAYNLLEEIEILAGGMDSFRKRCLVGIEADVERCRLYAERSAALATALSPYIGYRRAAELSKEALEKDQLIRELVLSKNLMERDKLEEILDIYKMTVEPEKREP